MNKIFKVIWNHTAQRFDVVSELTKSNGKSSSTTDNRIEPSKALLAVSMAGAALLGSAESMAAVSVGQPTAGGVLVETVGTTAGSTAKSPLYISTFPGTSNAVYGDIVLIGANASVDATAGGSVVIGVNALGNPLSTVVGQKAKSLGQQDVVIGAGAEQRNTSATSYSTAIGRQAIVGEKGGVAVAIGYNSLSNNTYTVAIGGNSTASGAGATAIAYNTSATGNGAIAVGLDANATQTNALAFGVRACATMGSATAIGSQARSFKEHAVALGSQSEANAIEGSVAIGWSAGVSDGATSGVAIGGATKSNGERAVAIGRSSHANGSRSVAIGTIARALGDNSIVIGNTSNTTIAATNSIAMGNTSVVSGSNSISIGPSSNVTGNTSIAVGAGNLVTGNNSGVFGDPSYITGNGSYAVGNNNTITTDNTFVLGSGINRHDTVLTTNLSGTVANSVYLGADSEVTAGAAATAGALKANTSAQTTDVATTAGATGTVTTATVGSLTYSGFQGASAVGGVAVGAAGTERRIQSVAAGEISATSTDAINGSQLYATNDVLGNIYNSTVAAIGGTVTPNTPNTGNFTVSFNLTGTNPSNSTPTEVTYTNIGSALTALSEAVNQPLTFTGDEGTTTRELGSTLQIVAGNAKNTSTRNVKTNVTEEGKLEISISDTPSFTNITVDGNKTSPITIGADAAGNNYITNLTTTIPVPATEVAAAAKPTTNLTNAATLGDVLNAGWNLKENNTAKDVVTPYDTVNFVNGTGTTANITTTDGNFSNVTYHVNVDNSTTEITYTTADGTKVYLQKDGTYNTKRDGSGNAVDEATITGSQVSAILPTFNNETVAGDINFANSTTTNITYNSTTGDVNVDVKTGTSSVSDGSATDENGAPIAAGKAVADVTNGTVATIADVVNTINSVYHSINSTTVADTNGENTYKVTDESKISAGDVVNYNAGQNIKISGEGNTVNISTTENVTFTNAVVNSTLSLGNNATDKSAPVVNMTAVNASTPVSNGNISAIDVAGSTITNLAPNLPETVSTGDAATSTTEQAAPPVTDAQKTNAATLGDVLNAGWNLQENGTAKDFVKPYDTVNFVNGTGTTANIATDGNTSNVTYNVNVDNSTTEITYTTADGTKVYQITNPDGSVSYNTKRDGSGDAVEAANITGSQVSAILPTFNNGTVAGDINFANSTTTNITYNSTTGDVNVDVKTGTSSVSDGSATDENGAPIAAGKAVADVTNGTVATIADVVETVNNVYWKTVAGNVSGTNGEFTSDDTAKVKAGDTVTHNAGKNIRIEQTGTTFNISTTENVTFTNAVVNSTLSLGDVANSTTSPVVNMTAVNASTPVSNGNISAIDVAGSTITNLAPNLPETVSTGDAATSTTEQAAPTVTDAQKTNAATLGDVLNAGWNLQENGTAKDFVKPYDTVNFVNGTGTTANITTDGNTSNVTYNVNVDNSTTEITYTTADGTKVYQITNPDGSVSYNTKRDGSGDAVEAANITGSQVSAILPTFNNGTVAGDINFANSTTTNITYNSTTGDVNVDVKTGTSSVSDGSATDADGNTIAAGKAVANTTSGTVATIDDVVNTINNVYHSVNSTTVAGTNGESTYSVNKDSQIGAGDVVNYNAGQNIKISGEGNNINISTTENVTFTNANVTNNLTVEGNTTVNNFTVNPNSTINMGGNTITNIKDGEKPTDAATVQQLENVTKNITGALSWKVTGNNNADNATTVGNQTVSFNNGTGTTAVVDGTNVTYNVNVDNTTTQITYVDANGNSVTKNADGTYSKADGTKVDAANVTSQVSVAFGDVAANATTGTVSTGDISPKVASTTDVANAINGSGWKTTDADGNTLVVNPGDTVNYVNGSGTTANITTSKDADGKDVVNVTFDVNVANPTTTNSNGSIAAPTDGANFVNATTLVNTVNNASWNVNAGAVEGTTGQSTYTAGDKVKAGDTVTINAGNNVIVSGSGKTINIATSTAPTFTTVQVGGSTGPVIGANENGDVKVSKADGSAAKITNVAAGTVDTDAVNVGQLKQVAGDIHNKINRNNKDLRAGIAGANAAAGLPQVYIPGKSMVAASAGTFKGQSAVAVGYSRASDNGKLILKLQGNANTRGDIGGSVGVGYQW